MRLLRRNIPIISTCEAYELTNLAPGDAVKELDELRGR
jgi:hypothetical protein